MEIIIPEKRKELITDFISHENVIVDSFTIENGSKQLPNIREGIYQSLLTGKIRITIEVTNKEMEAMFLKRSADLLI